MGNTLVGSSKKSVKIMKINGETFKLKTPIQAGSVLTNHPNHVLLESESVKHYGVRAKPLEPQQELKPKRLYFLVELPNINKFNEVESSSSSNYNKNARRVRSGIQMSAKDRLESLMLARRSASDLSILKPTTPSVEEERNDVGSVRVKMRVRRADVERLMKESVDEDDVAEKIVRLCMNGGGGGGGAAEEVEKGGRKLREKRVGFLPINEGEIQLAVAS